MRPIAVLALLVLAHAAPAADKVFDATEVAKFEKDWRDKIFQAQPDPLATKDEQKAQRSVYMKLRKDFETAKKQQNGINVTATGKVTSVTKSEANGRAYYQVTLELPGEAKRRDQVEFKTYDEVKKDQNLTVEGKLDTFDSILTAQMRTLYVRVFLESKPKITVK